MSDPGDFASALRDATGQLGEVVALQPGLLVPSCPGWTVERLVVHVGRIQQWVATALLAPDPGPVDPISRPAVGTDLSAWITTGAEQLLDALDQVGPTGAVRAPGWENSAAWWQRRMTHETVIHAWDAGSAAGMAPKIDRWLATDGIDEALNELAPVRLDRTTFGVAATIHLHCTDTPEGAEPQTPDAGEWLLTIGPDLVTTARVHGKGDVAVRAAASDLLLWVWGRTNADGLEVFGDAEVLGRYQAAANY